MGEDPIAPAAGTTEGMGIGEHPRGRRIGFTHMTDDQGGECLPAQALKMGALRRRVGFFRDTEHSVLECRQAPAIRVISNVAAAFAEATQKLSGRNRSTTAQSEQFAHDVRAEKSTPSYPPTARSAFRQPSMPSSTSIALVKPAPRSSSTAWPDMRLVRHTTASGRSRSDSSSGNRRGS